jgi:hypothetical protein
VVNGFDLLDQVSSEIVRPPDKSVLRAVAALSNGPLEPYGIKHLKFENEIKACKALEQLLVKCFEWEKEVTIEYKEGQRLRIDYLVWPKTGVDFPYPFFGVEVKRGTTDDYIRGLRQAIDYTECRVIGVELGDEMIASRFTGHRVDRVFVFPGVHSNLDSWISGANRLAGTFHVGMIYEKHGRVGPFFYISEIRVWDRWSGTNRCAPKHKLIGSGTVRRRQAGDLKHAS